MFDDMVKDFFILAIGFGVAYFCGYAMGRGELRTKQNGDKGGHF